jgi:hypothetical protein
MMEKQGIINEQNTRPETPEEKNLEQHVIKRAADQLNPPNPPLLPADRVAQFSGVVGNLASFDRIKIDDEAIDKLTPADRRSILRNG